VFAVFVRFCVNQIERTELQAVGMLEGRRDTIRVRKE
jgi:hypothetical protein